MSGDGKGYLIPQDVQPDGLCCITLWYPDDADGYYRQALLGAYDFFSTWIAWEKDADKRATLAAQAWKAAQQRTYEDMACQPIDYTESLNALADAIASIKINQTINVAGGGGGGSVGDIICTPDGQTVYLSPNDDLSRDYDGMPPDGTLTEFNPDDTLPDEIVQEWGQDLSEFDLYACRLANQYPVIIGRGLKAFDKAFDGIVTVVQVINVIQYAGLDYLIKKGGAAMLAKLARNVAVGEGLQGANNVLTTVGDSLISGELNQVVKCIVYNNRHNLPALNTALFQTVYDWAVDAAFSAENAEYVREFVQSLSPLEALVDLMFYAEFFDDLPPAGDCSGCDEPDVLYHWDLSTVPHWELAFARVAHQESVGQVNMHPKSGNSPNPTWMRVSGSNLRAALGLPGDAVLNLSSMVVEFTNENLTAPATDGSREILLVAYYEDGSSDTLTATYQPGLFSLAVDASKDMKRGGDAALYIGVEALTGANGEAAVTDIKVS